MRSKILEEKRQAAISLRSQGYTYSEIIKEVNVAKCTLAGWVRDIFPPDIEEKVRKIAQKKYKEKIHAWSRYRSNKILKEAEEYQEKYSRDIKTLSKKDLLLIGTSLYWAEGGKTNR